jgi:two-component system, response regulator
MQSSTRAGWTITVLLAEDDEDDRELINEALLNSGFGVRTRFVGDGQELLDYLRTDRSGENIAGREAPWPSLILLDLNMPRMDGREALAEIKSDPALRRIPVVVLTTSDDRDEVRTAYDLGANAFITKPVTYAGLLEVMGTVAKYWSEVVELPRAESDDAMG